MILELADEAATETFGARLAATSPDIGLVFLEGNLGAGKTTLVRGFLRELGHQGPVRSPTYTLVEPYDIAGRRVRHFDLYRLEDPEELEYLGVREDLGGQALNLVEWPRQGHGWLPAPDLCLSLTPATPGRRVHLLATSPAGEQWRRRVLENSP
ncbi:tRNA threonylcarbamoyladenosine biosynthesis protein TsaE [Ectothiorhodospira magna]|uniref:tRNA threonylcarbamoyladenosine biosynthesis protein TsaE n=1 Tax=Ectothiorhodospira magna TaxID=867345 RepID=A0A1H9G2V8_9GAMM|nr:tRNA (adenosine(37)-N6)-threonylcarbamoyltransferase complex ATPase subunit type 1 TsaE [Ectothiorhodospira magna]SEQ44434.1 tRNA threonylcarbamoyladenosine biosynthesis protein TsaE [Ectothiorhodospira magna]